MSVERNVGLDSFDNPVNLYDPSSNNVMDLSSNPSLNTYVYSGLYYAVPATGYFYAEEGLQTINLTPSIQLLEVDLTNSLQLLFSVEVINGLLGHFDVLNQTFDNSSVTINANTFVSNITTNNVVSLGSLSTMYTNYAKYVNDYFGYANGFNSLFARDGSSFQEYNIHHNSSTVNSITTTWTDNSFNPIDFTYLLHSNSLTPDGKYVHDLSGSVTINNVNSFLKDIKHNNTFGNRDGVTDLSSGFLPGDLIYIPYGFHIQLNTVINNNQIFQTQIGANRANVIDASGTVTDVSTITETASQPLFNTVLKIDPNNTYIQQDIKIPLLLILQNRENIGSSGV